MRISQKLKKLTENMNRSAFDRSAGFDGKGLNGIIQYDSTPAADRLLKYAKALGVSLEWLADEEADWPPIPRSEILDLPAALDPKSLKEFERLAEAHQGRGIVLAAAISLLLGVDAKERNDAIGKAAESAMARKKKKSA